MCTAEDALLVLLAKEELVVSEEGRVFFDELGNGRDLALANIDYFSTFLSPVLFLYFLLLTRRLHLITVTVLL